MFQVINVKQNNAGLELKPFRKQGNKDFKKKTYSCDIFTTFPSPDGSLLLSICRPTQSSERDLLLWPCLRLTPVRPVLRCGFILCACIARMFVYCLKFPIISYNSFLIEPKGGSENRVRERECEKWRLKERNQREKSIDEAISPPPPRVQCISFSPWNTITRREEWEEEEERKVREGRCWRRKKKKNERKRNIF